MKETMWEDHSTLFLSGGGLKVAAFIGCLEVLDVAAFEEVYGLSAGSLIACLLVAGQSVAQIRDKFLSTPWSTIFFESCSFGRILSGRAPLDGKRLRSVVETWLHESGVPRGATLAWLSKNRRTEFGCFAADLELGRVVLFRACSHPDAKLIDVVMASAALPGALDPVRVAGKLHVDLGICNNAPLSFLKPREGKKMLALVVNTQSLLLKDMLDSPAILLWLKCSFLTRAEILSADPKRVTVLEMPLPPAEVHLFRVSSDNMRSLIGQGRASVILRLIEKEVSGLFVLFAHVVLKAADARRRVLGELSERSGGRVEEPFYSRLFSGGRAAARAALEAVRAVVR
jgi:predicted acylesterase/phospholipase RssA